MLQFSDGLWYVTQKFSTKSSCLTYQFKTDQFGFKSVEQVGAWRVWQLTVLQVRRLPYTGAVGLDSDYVYTGKLYTPQEATPARMIVKFPLSRFQFHVSAKYIVRISFTDLIGAASYTVLAANYSSHGLVCTCQDVDLILTAAHRRSCSILQRQPGEIPSLR